MYKIISNNKVVDVLSSIHYFRILDSGHVAYTDRTSSIGFVGSDGVTLYSNNTDVLKKHPNIVDGSLIKISDEEFAELQLILSTLNQDSADSKLQEARNAKIQEMSLRCNTLIVEGVEVQLQDGEKHHFRMTVEDQLNLLFADRALSKGERYVLYHETNSTCRIFSAEDMKRIIDATNKHRQYHTTYFNLLKHCINTMNTVEEINNVVYGVDLQTMGITPEITVLLSGV